MTRARHLRCACLAIMLAASCFALVPRPAGADPTVPTFDRPLADPAAELRARALMKEIRCVVCQSQSIDESDADIAADLRNIVREQIAAGRSGPEVEAYLTARYGDFVLLDPPFKTRTLILWLGPFGLAALGGFGIFLATRKTAKAPPARAELTPAQRRRLGELLAGGEPHEQGGGS